MSEVILNMLPLEADERALFEAAAPEATHIYARRNTVTEEQLASATVIMGWPHAGSLSLAAKLRWFHCMWAGVNDYLESGTFPTGAALTSSAGTNSQSVSEHMLASLLALCRKLHLSRDNQVRHLWIDTGTMRTIRGATVLVVGAGHIGSQFCGLCKALGAHTIGLRRNVTAAPDGMDELHPISDLDSWLPKADVVALCLPQTPETIGLMNRRRMSLFKRNAILINSGRGTVLDQDALLDALREGLLWGAALDVTDPEPLPADHPLWDAPNLLITPHVAGGLRLDITRDNCVQLALENLRLYMASQPLKNTVLPQPRIT